MINLTALTFFSVALARLVNFSTGLGKATMEVRKQRLQKIKAFSETRLYICIVQVRIYFNLLQACFLFILTNSCLGGIRCEKASAFIRKKTDASEVYHLKGGIHRYVEKYGEEGYFGGKNFVFDRRISVQSGNSNKKIVGKCVYCDAPWDTFTPRNVCTVCRELVLICNQCKASFKELHCKDHFHLKSCYFTDLERFSCTELQQQLAELEKHHENIKKGKANKQRRKTLRKQIEKIQAMLSFNSIHETEHTLSESSKTKCRNCLLDDCNGECWGFHGLTRAKQLIKRQKQSTN